MADSRRLQTDNPQWWKERKYRLTASHFYDICENDKPWNNGRKRKGRATAAYLDPSRLLWPAPLNPVVQEMCQWGIDREKTALKVVSDALGRPLLDAGFCQSAEYSFIGASPDAFVPHMSGKNKGQPAAIVEVKCPFGVRYTGNRPKYISIDPKDKETFRLRANHRYFFQVQGQMYVTNLSYAIFAAWTPKITYITRVDRDPNFIQWMVKKLVAYYAEVYYPYLEKKNLLSSISDDDKKALEKIKKK